MKKYRITRVILRHNDGKKDILTSPILTDNLEVERKRIESEHGCKSAEFRFVENFGRAKYPVKHGK